MILYTKVYGSNGDGYTPRSIFKKVIPTGKWKIVNSIYMSNALYIQVKYLLFFTYWIHEEELFIGTEYKEYINECKIHERSTP